MNSANARTVAYQNLSASSRSLIRGQVRKNLADGKFNITAETHRIVTNWGISEAIARQLIHEALIGVAVNQTQFSQGI